MIFCILHTYVNDTFFLVKNQTFLKVFDNFWKNFDLKTNKSKNEISGISALKEVRMALCGMQCIRLNEQTVKIRGIQFSYNKKLEEEKNFNNHIIKMRDLTIEGKIVIFKAIVNLFSYERKEC